MIEDQRAGGPWILFLTEHSTVAVAHEDDYGPTHCGEERYPTQEAAVENAISWTLSTRDHLTGNLRSLRRRRNQLRKAERSL
jgi:hypothetical protein